MAAPSAFPEANGHAPLPFNPGPDVEWLDPSGFAASGPVEMALRPHSAPALARVLAAARKAHFPLVIHGAGTQQRYGQPPAARGVLDTRGLHQILAYEPEDMTITVQAGVTLGQLQARLAEHGQFLPLDPPLPQHATVGGLIATAAAGPLRLGFGSVRDHLIGVQLARPDGELTRAGGRVVKNVAGYELCKLYAGSWGTLGVITEATFKVRPRPRAWAAVQVALEGPEAAERAIAACLGGDADPLAVELLPRATAQAAGLLQSSPYALYVLLAGEPETVAWQVERTCELSRPAGSAQVLPDAESHVWPALVQAHRPGLGITLHAALLSSEVSRFVVEAEALAAGRQLQLLWAAHAGSGLVTLHLQAADPLLVAGLVNALRERAEQPATAAVDPDQSGRGRRAAQFAPTAAEREEALALGRGHLIVLDAPDAVRRHVSPWGSPPVSFRWMKALKQQFDPEGILNPGRFIDGL